MKKFQIAIDGPSGSGKSTLAKNVAKRLGILYLDTGAMYRACALCVLENKVSTKDEQAIEKLLPNINIDIEFENGNQKVILNGIDVTEEIRKPGISAAASDVSSFKRVRETMVEMQRNIAGDKNVVLDGRDIGSFVLPNADFKFFLTADPEERAKRRLEEMSVRGVSDITFAEVLADIKYRDRQDSMRSFAPLVKTKDAIVIDTTQNLPSDTLNQLIEHLPEELLKRDDGDNT